MWKGHMSLISRLKNPQAQPVQNRPGGTPESMKLYEKFRVNSDKALRAI